MSLSFSTSIAKAINALKSDTAYDPFHILKDGFGFDAMDGYYLVSVLLYKNSMSLFESLRARGVDLETSLEIAYVLAVWDQFHGAPQDGGVPIPRS